MVKPICTTASACAFKGFTKRCQNRAAFPFARHHIVVARGYELWDIIGSCKPEFEIVTVGHGGSSLQNLIIVKDALSWKN